MRIAGEQGTHHLDDTMLSNCSVGALILIGCNKEARCYLQGIKDGTDSSLMDQLHTIAFQPSADVAAKRENAHITGDTPMGVMLRFGSEAAKELYLSRHIAPRFAKAHIKGDNHIHDLDFYAQTTTWTQINLLKLIRGGFSTGHGMLRELQNIQRYEKSSSSSSSKSFSSGGSSLSDLLKGAAATATAGLVSGTVKCDSSIAGAISGLFSTTR